VQEINDGFKFKYNKDEMQAMFLKQLIDKVRASNFKGLNMSNSLLTLKNEIVTAEKCIEDLELNRGKCDENGLPLESKPAAEDMVRNENSNTKLLIAEFKNKIGDYEHLVEKIECKITEDA
jgi:predicted metalloprotease